MTAKHTPGPWKLRSIPGHLFEISSEKDVVLRIRSGMMPSFRDARLIAKAPELADALQGMVDWLTAALRELGPVTDETDGLWKRAMRARLHEARALLAAIDGADDFRPHSNSHADLRAGGRDHGDRLRAVGAI